VNFKSKIVGSVPPIELTTTLVCEQHWMYAKDSRCW